MCISAIAKEYRNLRTECASPLDPISVDGIGVLSTDKLKSILASKLIPARKSGDNFDVVRSDMGEVLAYMLLAQEYNTQIGYKSVRDRELIDLPGRGIDVIGVESGDKLSLLFGEVKVSNVDDCSPVVDGNRDSIRKALANHIKEHDATSRKLWSVIQKTKDAPVGELLKTAAVYWEFKKWTELSVICCGVLVRPKEKYKREEFGKLLNEPNLVDPAKIRFLIICMQCDLEKLANKFHRLATADESVS